MYNYINPVKKKRRFLSLLTSFQHFQYLQLLVDMENNLNPMGMNSKFRLKWSLLSSF